MMTARPRWFDWLARRKADGAIAPALNLRIEYEMLDETARLAPYSAWAHGCVVIFVAVLYWPRVSHAYLVGLALIVLGFCAAAVTGARRLTGRTMTDATLARARRFAAVTATGLSVAWASVPFAIFIPADPSNRLLLTSIVAGLISNAMVLGPIPLVSVPFMSVIVVSSMAACLLSGDPIIELTAALDVIYGAFVLLNILHLSQEARQRSLARVKVEEQSALISLLLRDFEENSSDWLWETDGEQLLHHVSKRFADVSGRPREEMRGLSLGRLIKEIIAPSSREIAATLVQALAEKAAFRDLAFEVRVGESSFWWSLSGKPRFDSVGAFTGYRGVGSDITAARRSEARVNFLARHDVLTGLPNRVSLGEALEAAVAACHVQGRETDGGFALLSLDLDQFKAVNDTLGHHAGDELLAEVARRLRATVPERATVARLGGDEFAVLYPGALAADALRLGRRIVTTLSLPYRIEARQILIGASVGATLAPLDAVDAAVLMKFADMALYQAKADGRGCVRLFDREMEALTKRRRALEASLRRALDRGELRVEYQPIVSAGHLGVAGFEALLRWRHPQWGEIAPSEFIPAAESTGLIVPIGAWVLKEACREASAWRSEVRLAVNISPVQIAHADLVQIVSSVLAESGLDATRLELEMTESIFLEATAETQACLAQLRALGVRFALDDFGTGYSSLSYLSQFAFDKIKIDRSFVRDMDTRREAGAVIQAIVTLGQTLGVTVTAEGVETPQQLRRLAEEGCHELQGFLFSPSAPAERTAVTAASATAALPWSRSQSNENERVSILAAH